MEAPSLLGLRHNTPQALLAPEAAGPVLPSTLWLRGEATPWGTWETAAGNKWKEGVGWEAGG